MASGCLIKYKGKRGVVWRIKYADAAGKQVMETLGRQADGWSEKKAHEALEDRRSDVRRKGLRKPERLTFGDYKRTWFAEAQKRRAWKPNTLATYRSVLKRLSGFDPIPLASIRPRDIAEHIRDAQAAGYAAKSINLEISVLHDILKVAKAEELIESNVAEGIERPKVRRRRWRILKPDEVVRVLNAFNDEQSRAIFLTLQLTGIRRFELQGLRWRDISFVERILRVAESKTEQGERTIALAPPLVAELEAQYRRTAFKGDDERVFCHPRLGSKIHHGQYADEFRAALKTAGISDYIRPFHDARHGSLTNGAAAGESPIELMTRAGHSSMSTTKTYLHLAGQVFLEAASALADRMLGGVELSTNLSEPKDTYDDRGAHNEAESAPTD